MKNAPRYPAHAENLRPRTWVLPIAAAILALALFVATGVLYGYSRLDANLTTKNLNDYLDDRPSIDAQGNQIEPFKKGEPVNILLLGSDVRNEETNGGPSDVVGMRSDTTMLMHISADRQRIEVVSIPRDLLVDIPSCRLADGTWSEKRDTAIFNSAFTIGGEGDDVGAAAACTIRTVEKMSDVYIDGYAVVDFASFKTFVDVLGGVDMCFDEPVKDTYSGLDVPAGCFKLDGEGALAFARARHGFGDGSDIGRMDRQQDLVFSMIDAALAKDIFTDLPTLYRFIDAVSQSIVVSDELGNIDTLASLALSVRGVSDHIFLMTLPWLPAGPRVTPAPEAELVWKALDNDEPLSTYFDENGQALPTEKPSSSVDNQTDEPSESAQ